MTGSGRNPEPERPGWASGEARDFWNDPSRVEMFARREPDQRLVALCREYPRPEQVRVLDLGCAAGRNAVFLAERGFDLVAVDLSAAMVSHTRGRLAGRYPAADLERRVREAPMTDLGFLAAGEIDFVVGLGVFHQAASDEEWTRAIDEVGRVLGPGGRCLVANFAPGSGPIQAPPRRRAGTRYVHDGMGQGPVCLLEPGELDGEFAARGFEPETPSAVVERTEDGRRRRTVNALYRRSDGRPTTGRAQ